MPSEERRLMLRTVCVVVALAAMPAAAQPRFSVTVVGGPPQAAPSGPLSLPLSLNDHGRVVGYSYAPGGNTRAMNWRAGSLSSLSGLGSFGATYANHVNILGRVAGAGDVMNAAGQVVGTRALKWTGGVVSDLGGLGGNYAAALSINDADQIVGYATLPGEAEVRAFIFQNGVMAPIAPFPGTTESYAYDISNTGFVAGTCVAGSPAKPFVWRAGASLALPIPAWSRTGAANAVNDTGVAVGAWEANQFTGAFVACLWSGAQRVDLPNLGGPVPYAVALDINGSGQIVGTSYAPTGYSGFLYQAGHMYDLRALTVDPVEITSAHAVNNLGQIAASAIINGREMAVLLTPMASGAGGD
jgi:probable HAF family extracellular repeat protein